MCNPFYYFVRKLPFRMQSRWYIFDRYYGTDGDSESESDGYSESDTDGDKDNVPNLVNADVSSICGVYFEGPIWQIEEILTAISNLKQTIRYVNINHAFPLKDIKIKVPFFRMDPNAHYVIFVGHRYLQMLRWI